jgi:hypothetical protein
MERMAICPRCGFGSSPEERQWEKFAVMQKVAHDVWG